MDKQKIIPISSLFAAMLILSLLYLFMHNSHGTSFNFNSTPGIVKESSMPKHNVSPIVSNQWYSNIYTTFPTQPIFVMPQAYKLTPQGLEVSLPKVKKTSNTIFASFNPDFSVGFDQPLQKPTITSIGDWNINVLMKAGNNALSFSLSHGTPFTVLHVKGDTLTFTLKGSFEVLDSGKNIITGNGNKTSNNFMLSANNNYYAIVLNQDAEATVFNNTVVIKNPKRIFIGILDNNNHYNLFVQNAQAEIVNTYADIRVDTSNSTTVFTLDSPATPLIVLYPHQIDTLQNHLPKLGEYDSLRGKLRLVKTDTFTQQLQNLEPSLTFQQLTPLPDDFIKALKADIADIMLKPIPASKDYFLGTWFGKASSLLQLAKSAGLTKEQQTLIEFLEPKFESALANFNYDKAKTSVLATTPEFGNENLNDHHFHYGYYIRTAAVLSSLDPSYTNKIKDKITPLVNDIATYTRDSKNYPFLRNFDAYESHSWADGFANFGDGNNQESTSEAINAWYGVFLWGTVTNDNQLKTIGLYLYNSEIQGAKYYWFGKNGMYINPYAHPMASLVWGGKVDFATWFSGETNMKYGIQLLPFTPASVYLKTFPNFTALRSDYTDSGGNITKAWGDLYLMWKSFYFPQEAMKEKNNVTNLEADNPKSLFLYFLYLNIQNNK